MTDTTQVDMSERYKNWMEALVRYVVLAIEVGKEVAGEAYLKKLEEEFYKIGARSAAHWKQLAELGEGECDCIAMGKVMDAVDDAYANWWDGYVENSPKAFEKHVLSCPIEKPLKRAPEFCERMIAASALGLMQTINPDATITFDKFLSKGDDICHYRIETAPRD